MWCWDVRNTGTVCDSTVQLHYKVFFPLAGFICPNVLQLLCCVWISLEMLDWTWTEVHFVTVAVDGCRRMPLHRTETDKLFTAAKLRQTARNITIHNMALMYVVWAQYLQNMRCKYPHPFIISLWYATGIDQHVRFSCICDDQAPFCQIPLANSVTFYLSVLMNSCSGPFI